MGLGAGDLPVFIIPFECYLVQEEFLDFPRRKILKFSPKPSVTRGTVSLVTSPLAHLISMNMLGFSREGALFPHPQCQELGLAYRK